MSRIVVIILTLSIGVSLTPIFPALGASPVSRRSGAFRSSGTHRHGTFSHRFPQAGFIGTDGLGDQDVIIIQQFYPAPPSEPRQPGQKEIYVQPRWVDAGYGVQLLQPGYWVEPANAPKP